MLDIVILQKSPKPIYEQLYESIASQIMKGELCANYCLPSIRQVARELNISIITVKKAWEMLEQNQLIYTRGGKGCFVTEEFIHTLDAKRIDTAKEKLKEELVFYKNLGISKEEYIKLVEEEY